MNDLRRVIAEQRAALGDAPTVLQVARSLGVLDALPGNEAGLRTLRVGVVGSFTFEPLVKPLRARAYGDGLRLDVYVAPFGQYIQELINPDSGLHRFRPEVILAAVRLQDACPELYADFNSLDPSRASSATSRWQAEWAGALKSCRRHSQARLLCTNYEEPAHLSLGLADARAAPSQRALIRELNQWLSQCAERIGDCQIMDVDGLTARCGREGWTDPRLWFHARLPIAPAHHWAYAGEAVRLLRGGLGLTRKVLALDADDTLWGGILGEVGREGIALGQDFPGNGFVAFQRRALELWRRGVVLVVASKNEPDAVMDVFRNHPDMVLRPEHIACFAVNWSPKPDNLRKAAESLNLGLESFVFVDNDAVECAMMQEMLPEVLTVRLPEDPAEHERTLARLDCFDQLIVSDEDRARGALYRQEAVRAELKASSSDLESFYRQLGMRMMVSCNEPADAARAAQLTQRTNQFNMTTVRRTESQIRALMGDGTHRVWTLRLADRFGDNGIVGSAVADCTQAAWVLESFLMSCRVLGRTVEQSFLTWIARRARDAGIRRLVALYRPTSKNAPFSGFYKSWGMGHESTDADAVQRWACDLADIEPAMPPWIDLRTA